ncbi:MAG: type II toxin-antitoxin system PemK/MazF family toxin [Nocardiopsaceae bacterium]|nr:type II toxin-antitoxin system PemK/MazF family toxin [Nocardiopsaceae bacterium]
MQRRGPGLNFLVTGADVKEPDVFRRQAHTDLHTSDTGPTGLSRDSKAQAEQVRSIAVERIGACVGRLPPALMAELDQALRIQLSL